MFKIAILIWAHFNLFRLFSIFIIFYISLKNRFPKDHGWCVEDSNPLLPNARCRRIHGRFNHCSKLKYSLFWGWCHKRIKQLPTLIYALWLVKTSDMTCSGQSVCLISVLRNYIILKFLMTLTPSRLFYFFSSCLFLQKAIT